MRSYLSREELNQEEGTAFVEFLLCLPFILSLIIAVIDIGRALALYMTIARISFEGARYFATLPGAAQQSCTVGNAFSACSKTGSTVDGVHLRVRDRLAPLFERTIADVTKSSVTTELYGPNNANPIPGAVAGTAGAQTRIVRVTITTEFEPYFPTFGLLSSLSASSTGPYLLQNMAS